MALNACATTDSYSTAPYFDEPYSWERSYPGNGRLWVTDANYGIDPLSYHPAEE